MLGAADRMLDDNDDCTGSLSLEALRMRSSIEARLFESPEVPLKVGRFVVVERIGQGGMGMVYRAYDPRLDRAVAVKVLRRSGGSTALRLEREAHVMARLNHPNVVTIHEVGDGPHGVFVAMELVDGGTLAQWCRRHPLDEPGRWRRVLELARQAAQGLAAAHAIGLVHRDLKPANMLIGRDGRLRLADFGLAALGSGDLELDASRSSVSGSIPASGTRLTALGAVVGTPAYMAPEQLDGRADGKSDQFSFCATFFEAFCGARPYGGDTLDDLRTSFRRGQPERPTGARVPAAILAVLERGLRVRPEDRFADMQALAQALERAGRGRRGWIALGVAAAVIAALGVLGMRQAPCTLDPAAIGPAWDDARAQQVRAAFLASALPSAAGTLARLETHLSRTAARWTEQATAACERERSPDPSVRAEAEAARACLVQAQATIDRATRELAAAGDDTVVRAMSVADLVADLGDCSQPGRVENTTDSARALVDVLHRGRVALELARLDEAEAAFREAIAGAGELPRIQSEAHGLLAGLHATREERDLAREQAERALDAAEVAGDPDLLAKRWVALATIVDKGGGSVEEARFMIGRARKLEERGLLGALTRADLDHKEGGILQRHKQWADAIPYYERAAKQYAAEQHAYPSAQAQLQLGECLAMSSDLNAGIAAIEGAVATLEAHFGPEHPEVAYFRIILAETVGFTLDYRGAEAVVDRAIAVFDQHPQWKPSARIGAYQTRSMMRMAQARYPDALADVDHAIEQLIALGTKRDQLPTAYRDRARILRRLDREEEALASLDEAARLQPDPPEQTRLFSLWIRAEVLADLGRFEEAGAAIDATAPLRSKLSLDSMSGLQAAEETARILTTLQREAEAVPILEAAIPHADADYPNWRVRLELQLAMTLKSRGDRAGAKVHVKAAEAALAAGAEAQPSVREQVQALAAELADP